MVVNAVPLTRVNRPGFPGGSNSLREGAFYPNTEDLTRVAEARLAIVSATVTSLTDAEARP